MPNDKTAVVHALKEVTSVLRADDAPLEEEAFDTSPARLLDLALFYKTLDALGNAGQEMFDAEAKRLAAIYMAEFIANIEKLSEVFDSPGIKTAARPWTRSGSRLRLPRKTDAAHRARGRFVTNLLGVMRNKTNVLRDAFGQGADLLNAKRLGAVADAEGGQSELLALSDVRLRGPKTRTRRYVSQAIKEAGIEVTDFDEALDEASTSRMLGDTIRNLDSQLASETDPASIEKIKRSRAGVVLQIEKMAQESSNPQAVVGNATSAAVSNSVMVTEIGKRLFRQDTQQENAMLVGTRNPKSQGKSIIAAGAGSGKCLTGDTVIATIEGPRRLDRCRDVKSLPSVDATTLNSSLEEGEWLDMGTSPTFRLVTSSGIVIVGTPEHPLLTWTATGPQWKKLQDIQTDDCLLLSPGYALEWGTACVDPDEAYLIGLWMGNGHTWQAPKNGTTQWSSVNEDLIGPFYALSEKFWGYRPRSSDGKEHHVSSSVHLRLKEQGFLPDDGVSSSNARVKKVPEWLVGASSAERVSFLQGLFDTDGTATGDRSFEYLSASEDLARSVHQMLIGLGVVGRLKPWDNVKGYENHTYWRVLIGGDQLRKFRDLIGFRYDRKKKVDLEFLCDKDENPNVGCYPHVGTLLKKVREEWKRQGRWEGRTQKLDENGSWITVSDYLLESRAPSKARLQRLVSGCTSDAANLLERLTSYYPDPVASCVPAGEERVYDFSVPTTHSFIANGIVSHNTRVLAGRVVYTTLPKPEGLGAAPHQIIATSFTRASAAELGERINDYAAKMGHTPIVKRGAKGFGTTHAVAARIMRSLNDLGVTSADAPTIGSRKEDDLSPYKLIKMAITQVKLPPESPPPSQADPNESFFSESAIAELSKGDDSRQDKEREGKRIFTDKVAVLNALAEWIVSPAAKSLADNPPRGSGWYWTVGYKQKRKDYDVVAVTKDIIRKVSSGYPPTDMQQRRLEEALDMANFFYDRSGVSASTQVEMPWAQQREGIDVVSASTLSGAGKKKYYESPFQTAPANQWFNLDVLGAYAEAEGVHPSVVKLSDVKLNRGGDDGDNITVGDVERALDLWKGNLITPGKAWSDPQAALAASQVPHSHLAACYAAYEWLKKNDIEYVGGYDGNDLFINFSKEMIRNPAALASVNQKFRHIMVDESQDLNASQHLMFGFIAGAIDPATQEPWPDGHMKAETFTLIGDGNQAIYEFRGANPKVFMSKSDMTEGGEQYETAIIESNYRSGKRIVEAANRLIMYNTERIPMTCDARNLEMGEGAIREVKTGSYKETVSLAVGQMKEMTESEDSDSKYGDFGVALRTNGEVLSWTTELLANNIPFRCKDRFNPLKNRSAKAIINWLKLANADENDHKTINDLMTKGEGQPLTANPSSGVSGKTLADRLDNLSTDSRYLGKNYLQMLEAGAWKEIYKGRAARMNDELVRPLMENLRRIKDLSGSPTALVEQVLDLEGKAKISMKSTFVARVSDDDEAMRAIYQVLGDNATQEMIDLAIEEIALTPIEPVIGLLENHGTISSAGEYIQRLEIANGSLHKSDVDVLSDAVVCDTVHGWKGLEVEHLYVPMTDTTFPNTRAPIESERRLAYVALTRGKQSVTIMSPATDHYGHEAGTSQFVEEACVGHVPGNPADPGDLPTPKGDDQAPVEGASQRHSEPADPEGDARAARTGWDPAVHLSAAASGKEFADAVLRNVPVEEHLRSRTFQSHFAGVMDKHHPDASAYETAHALGGWATFLDDVEFDEDG